MIHLEVGVFTLDPREALQRGAIVTLALIAGLEGERIASRQQKTLVMDIVRDEPKYTRVSFEQPGIYELTVRLPSRTEIREVTVEESTSLTIEVRPSATAADFLAGIDWSDLARSNVRLPELKGTLPNAIGRAHVMNTLDFLALREMNTPDYTNFKSTNLLAPFTVNGIEAPRFSRSTVIGSPTVNELNNIYLALSGLPTNGATPARWTNCFGVSGRDLVSIPWIWFPLIEDEDRSVELKLSRKESVSGLTTALHVRDTKWGALLELVTQGRMQDAALVADSLLEGHGSSLGGRTLPEYALEGKLREPLVAALGGIILVSNIADLQRKRWDDWLENLANWFPNMPDAAAIYGYRCLQMGEIEEANLWLTRSVNQGLPFFSATFRLLTLGFSQLEDRRSLDLISPAAAAVDVTQPFTVIHVPWGTTTRDPATTEGHG